LKDVTTKSPGKELKRIRETMAERNSRLVASGKKIHHSPLRALVPFFGCQSLIIDTQVMLTQNFRKCFERAAKCDDSTRTSDSGDKQISELLVAISASDPRPAL